MLPELIAIGTILSAIGSNEDQASNSHESLYIVGKAIRKWCHSNESLQILDADDALKNSDWGAGGCLVLALAPLLPGAEVWGIYRDGRLDHAVVHWQDGWIDHRGATLRSSTIWNRNLKELNPEQRSHPILLTRLRPEDTHGTSTVLAPPTTIEAVAKALADLFTVH